jgi:DNA mismatch repair ATPase MutS
MKFSQIQQLLALMCCMTIHTTFGEISRDLELDAFFNKINYTQTMHGSKALQNLLANPTDNLQTLQSRQCLISHIIEDESLYANLNDLLHQFSTHEPYFENMLQQASDIETVALEDFYFSHSYFKEWNYCPTCLELGQFAYFCNLCSSLVQHSLTYAVFTLGLGEEHLCSDPHHHHHHHDHKDKTNENNVPKENKKKQNPLLKKLKTFAKSPSIRYAFHIWHIIAQAQELYSIQAIMRNHCNCITEIQKQLIGIANGMRTLHTFYTILEDHSEITEHMIFYKDLKNICLSTNTSQKLQKLLALLKTNTFKGKASPFSRIGIILAAYRLIQEIGPELQPALNAVGEIDAYVSCAHLFNKHKSSSCQYSFAHYITNATAPSLQAHNFWHPFMSTDNMQLNSICLGAQNHQRNIILTGPNACGKSTNIKALTLCAYLAQTIGLVPAQEFSQTLYKEVYSSMIVSDNIQENRSLFVTELTDAEELLTRVENLAHNEYMLIALDELFKSTHHEKGQLIAQRLLEKLYESPQVITLVSTHFEKLSELARAQIHECTNYTVNNFILEPGIGSPENSFDLVNAQTKGRLLQ